MKSDGSLGDITLQLSTFVVRYLVATRALTDSLVDVIAEVQDEINFGEVVGFLIREKLKSDLFMLILNSKLTAKTRDKIAIISLYLVIKDEDFAFAIELWQRFDQQLLNSSEELCKSLVYAFGGSPFLLEYKLYFLDKAFIKMNFKQMDQIITELERDIFPQGSDPTSLLLF